MKSPFEELEQLVVAAIVQAFGQEFSGFDPAL